MTVVVGFHRKRFRCRRHCRRHIGMECRGVCFAALAVHAAGMVYLRVGKEVIGRRWLLWPMLGMRHRIGHQMQVLGRAWRSVTGKMRHRLMAALRLDEHHVFAGRRMVRGRIHLRGIGGAETMAGGSRRIEVLADMMLGGIWRIKAMASAMLGNARSIEPVAAMMLGTAWAIKTLTVAVVGRPCASAAMVRTGWAGGVMRCHVRRHVHVVGCTRMMSGGRMGSSLMAIMRRDKRHVIVSR